MTDRFNALSALVTGHPLAEQAWRVHALFANGRSSTSGSACRWQRLTARAASCHREALMKQGLQPAQPEPRPQRHQQLAATRRFSPDAAGYAFWADRVMELDAINPQVATPGRARTGYWPNRTAARGNYRPRGRKSGLSKDTHEVISRPWPTGSAPIFTGTSMTKSITDPLPDRTTPGRAHPPVRRCCWKSARACKISRGRHAGRARQRHGQRR
jgi:hypothetical protein